MGVPTKIEKFYLIRLERQGFYKILQKKFQIKVAYG